MALSPLAGQLPRPDRLVDIPSLVSAYYTGIPDTSVPDQRVAFGTSGHRGGSLRNSFNEAHILAITQAICAYRKQKGIDGPLFIGMDTHALSSPAHSSALEVLAANGIATMVAVNGDYTPTPAVSHAILRYNEGRTTGLADGIIITPSHNPPDDGGFKYNPPSGGPADTDITKWIQDTANSLLERFVNGDTAGIRRIPLARALKSPTTHRHDYLNNYVDDLGNVLDMDAIRGGSAKICVAPLGGAGIHYWQPIAQKYKLALTVVDGFADPTFRFMPYDHDGKIRMDPSSPYAMNELVRLRDKFDLVVACDTDHDRHGIVTSHAGLLPPNHYLCVCIDYLFRNRPGWSPQAAVGKTLVSSALIDRVTAAVGRRLREVPVGFKWFVDGLLDGSLGFVGEESAGAAFLRRNGKVWTTDKDGFIPALLSAEIMARTGRDPGERYESLTKQFGAPVYDRIDAPANAAQKKALSQLNPQQITQKELAGEPIRSMMTTAPGNNAPIGGLKVSTDNGWFAARPSGTEEIYKIYAESFLGNDHLRRILSDAQLIVDKAVSPAVTSVSSH
ncbi:MAG TPA: phosphoglucomutase (alpha-D-glucose-1,6-bisphosphate-dependent) [Puia sp.]|nr:phosphoglucomutase (alpha-D-glucose-1,6-bisphosphate-dependent) [Puia sp.]